ncbi:coiled-coil domain-containing protein 134-like [Zootermopsis nevadensis]|uniref:Coiled-coil domain-containing protein 134 n=1 Tax=Zootermopsis nevadensis TaxID=136037 RepID=A0A067QPH2_ZOONE|nr:coiled-coil domain-containing protein 134-like [Zootermopsis nevadensis]KDQ71586.1 Coiled-coil domain-containing protein 134 [Zootermopsis nevadensis]
MYHSTYVTCLNTSAMLHISIIIYCLIVVASQSPEHDHGDSRKMNDDPAEQLFVRMFMKRRTEQLAAVKRLLAIDSYEKQYKMVSVIAEKVFSVIKSSRVTLESLGYIPGISAFPKDEDTLDALANILENTALFGDILLRLPDISHKILISKHEWEVSLQWSLGFSNQTHLLDKQTQKLVYLASQEINVTERNPNYLNPYSKIHKQKHDKQQSPEQNVAKKKKMKKHKKGPRMSSGTFTGDL